MPLKDQTENLYFSYDIKEVHFVSLNSEIPYLIKITKPNSKIG